MKRWVLWVPLALFVGFAAIALVRLNRPVDNAIVSRMVGKPLPAFALPAALPGKPGLASRDLTDGKPRLVNVFASWCVPCAVEAPQLAALRDAGVEVVGIAIRDRPEALADFLQRHGDPFTRIGGDTESRVQIALGSAGVPESFVVDGKGIIRYQQIGEIHDEDMPKILAALGMLG